MTLTNETQKHHSSGIEENYKIVKVLNYSMCSQFPYSALPRLYLSSSCYDGASHITFLSDLWSVKYGYSLLQNCVDFTTLHNAPPNTILLDLRMSGKVYSSVYKLLKL